MIFPVPSLGILNLRTENVAIQAIFDNNCASENRSRAWSQWVIATTQANFTKGVTQPRVCRGIAKGLSFDGAIDPAVDRAVAPSTSSRRSLKDGSTGYPKKNTTTLPISCNLKYCHNLHRRSRHLTYASSLHMSYIEEHRI